MSEGITGYEVRTDSLYGMVTKLSYGSLYVDIDGNNRSVVSLAGDRSAEKAYVLNTGMMSSLYENTVLEELTGVESVSTVSIFAEAEAEGIGIVRVHEGNLSEQMGSLQVSESVKEAVRTAVNAGNIVTITAENVTIGDWTGAGYIITDPKTGAGAYKISGGLGTGETDGGSLGCIAYMTLLAGTMANASLTALSVLSVLAFFTSPLSAGMIIGFALTLALAIWSINSLVSEEAELLDNYEKYKATGDTRYLRNMSRATIEQGAMLALCGITMKIAERLTGRKNGTGEKTESVVQVIADNAAKKYNTIYDPAEKAISKGYTGVIKTSNNGVSFQGTDYIYKVNGEEAVATIRATGSRKGDFRLANAKFGLESVPDGYVWHHLDNYNVTDNTMTLELIEENAHKAAIPHAGACAQYNAVHMEKYK